MTLLVGLWVVCGLGIAAPARYTDPVKAAVNDALRPGRTAAQTATAWLQATWGRFQTPETDDELGELQAEVAVLRSKLQQQQTRLVAQVQQTSAESVMPADPLLTSNLVPAAILGRQPDLLRARFARILDRGTTSTIAVEDLVLADAPHMDQGADRGVEESQPVISGGVVVGTIGRAGRWTSTLQLVTDPAFRANVQLVRESPAGLVLGSAGVLVGNGNDTCDLQRVPETEPVSEGDYVYSLQQDVDQMPPLYYGRVVAAERNSGEHDWRIQVQPAFDPEALKTVQILTVSLNPQRIGAINPLMPLDEQDLAADLLSPTDPAGGEPSQ